MKKFSALLLLGTASLFARSAETRYFRAILSPANEVPPIEITASGNATVIAHVVRDDAGQVAEGSVDFIVNYAFGSAVTITGLHIHPGAAGTNGGVVIDSGLSPNNTVVSETGSGMLNLQGQVRPGSSAAVAALRGMLENPSQYYVNLHTTDFPGGVIRGQLQAADTAVFMGLMNSFNEVPAIPELAAASGVSHVLVVTTRNSSGALTSGQMVFDVNYRFPQQTTFTGFHIHNGPAGMNAGVIFNTGIGAGASSVTSEATGVGNIRRFVEINMASPTQVSLLQAMLRDPSGFYINLHTTEYPGGAIRAQMRMADRMRFQVTMLTSNEVPPITGLDASAVANLEINTVRAGDGTVLAGVAAFDINHRFPGAATFTGLHIHDEVAGANGGVTINTGLSGTNSVTTETGFGNIYRRVTVSEAAGIATLNSLVRNPENHYVNLHTTVHPGGVVRAQLAPANTSRPAVAAVISANLDVNATTLAPGGLITIFGTNLAKVTTDLTGWQGSTLPDLLNGVAVAVGGQRARLLYVSPYQVNAQLAFETPTGQQLLSVNNGNAPSFPATVTVAGVAPAVFFTPEGGIILKNADFSLVGPGNPARAGDVVLIYATGLGQTTPPLTTGVLPPVSPLSDTVPVTVTIGGQNAAVVYSVASPGFVGLYQVAATVPAGLAPGNVPVVLRSGTAASGPVPMAVQ